MIYVHWFFLKQLGIFILTRSSAVAGLYDLKNDYRNLEATNKNCIHYSVDVWNRSLFSLISKVFPIFVKNSHEKVCCKQGPLTNL